MKKVSYRSRAIRKTLAADTFFPCDHPLVGTNLPGKKPRAGVISGCATPSKKHPHELQLAVGLPGLGEHLRLSTVRTRIRDGKIPRVDPDDSEKVSRAVAEYRATEVPYPVGRLHPGRPGKSKCDPENELWSGYTEVLDDAFLQAAESCARSRRGCSPDDEAQRVKEIIARSPQGAEWSRVASQCVVNYDRTVTRSGSHTDAKQMAQWKAEYLSDPENDQDARIESREFRDWIRERGWDDSAYTAKLAAKKRAKIKSQAPKKRSK